MKGNVNFRFMYIYYYFSIHQTHAVSETFKQFFILGFQAWEQSAGVIVFPNIQLLASEVSKLLTKEIKKNLNGKPAGNDPIAFLLGICCYSAVFYAMLHTLHEGNKENRKC